LIIAALIEADATAVASASISHGDILDKNKYED
jgi:hypothetical protein